jgi:hypothetical protein
VNSAVQCQVKHPEYGLGKFSTHQRRSLLVEHYPSASGIKWYEDLGVHEALKVRFRPNYNQKRKHRVEEHKVGTKQEAPKN